MAIIDRKTESFENSQLTEEEVELARAGLDLIHKALDHSRAASIAIESNGDETPAVKLTPRVMKTIGHVLRLMSLGKPIVMLHEKQQLSTVEAANMLGVSRPFLIKEIDAGRIEHSMVGSHRRIKVEDLRKYADTMKSNRKNALDRMAKNANELGIDF